MAKLAVITGASAGIGAALALEMARRGFDVGLIARREELLREVVASVQAEGRRAAFAVADVADAAALARAFTVLEAALGPVEVAVANAGVAGSPQAQNLDLEAVRRLHEVNFLGAAAVAALALPGMLARGRGRLAVISSVAGYRGLPRSGAYCAAKAAASTFFESLRVELRGSGVSCTVVEPGFVATAMTAERKRRLPFLMPASEAAQRIARGVLAGKRRVVFPRRMALIMRVVRCLPDWAYDRLVTRRSDHK
ncbi:MAG: SDR family NAD(P)-dependent oxidoreductase [Planctomycetes bacterium]|nr:SDR family NAD(P)-dependent oxidoreductase [Planctomycetota bacterium]